MGIDSAPRPAPGSQKRQSGQPPGPVVAAVPTGTVTPMDAHPSRSLDPTPTNPVAPTPAHLLATYTDVPWAPTPNTLEVLDLTQALGRGAPAVTGTRALGLEVTSVMVLLTDAAGDLLLTHVDSRGWDLPGGHREAGEECRQAALRELVEETGVDAAHVSALEVRAVQCLHVDGPAPCGYTYPHPDSAQVIFTATYAGARIPLRPDPTLECSAAEWVPVTQVRHRVGERTWVAVLDE